MQVSVWTHVFVSPGQTWYRMAGSDGTAINHSVS